MRTKPSSCRDADRDAASTTGDTSAGCAASKDAGGKATAAAAADTAASRVAGSRLPATLRPRKARKKPLMRPVARNPPENAALLLTISSLSACAPDDFDRETPK
eukprot:scaffold57_cov254-Pinguiococcus_pyrenoidosus.AAC.14